VGQQQLIILGCGGNARDIAEMLTDDPRYQLIGFLDENTALHHTQLDGVPVLGGLDQLPAHPRAQVVNAVGSPASYPHRAAIVERTGLPSERFATLIHPTASVSRSASIGPGTVILQQVTVTRNVTIGAHVIILPNSVVSHDCVIGDYTCIAGCVCLCGGVTVGESCYIGAAAAVRDGIAIGDGALVGIGSVVIRPVAVGTTVAGCPARPMPRR